MKHRARIAVALATLFFVATVVIFVGPVQRVPPTDRALAPERTMTEPDMPSGALARTAAPPPVVRRFGFDARPGDTFEIEIDLDSTVTMAGESGVGPATGLSLDATVELRVLTRERGGYVVSARFHGVDGFAGDERHRIRDAAFDGETLFRLSPASGVTAFAFPAEFEQAKSAARTVLSRLHGWVFSSRSVVSWEARLSDEMGPNRSTFRWMTASRDTLKRKKTVVERAESVGILTSEAVAEFGHGWLSRYEEVEETETGLLGLGLTGSHSLTAVQTGRGHSPVTRREIAGVREASWTPTYELETADRSRLPGTGPTVDLDLALGELRRLGTDGGLDTRRAYELWLELVAWIEAEPGKVLPELTRRVLEEEFGAATGIVISSIGRAAGKFGLAAATAALGTILERAPTDRVREQAIVSSHQLGPFAEQFLPSLARASEIGSVEVRDAALLAAGTLLAENDSMLLDRMIENYRGEDAVYLDALTNSRVPELIEENLAFIHDSNLTTRQTAVRNLRHAAPEVAISPLHEKAIDRQEDPLVRRTALDSLGELLSTSVGDRAFEILADVAVAADRSLAERTSALQALARDSRGRAILETVASQGGDRVSETARDVLESLRPEER